MKLITIQVLVTQRCNAVCDYCDKAVGLAKLPDIEMTSADMERFVDEANKQDFPVGICDLSGGEPILNPELQGIINAADRFKYLVKGRVYSNGLHKSGANRGKITLPDERWDWRVSPLDDLDDPFSGKNLPGVRYRNRTHVQYFVSPADMGLKATYRDCTVKHHCGRGLDNNGWSMCGQAPILGRILGINPYPKIGTIMEKVNHPIEEICKHCRYGLPKGQKKLVDDYPHYLSPTFEEAFNREPRPDFKPVVQITSKV